MRLLSLCVVSLVAALSSAQQSIFPGVKLAAAPLIDGTINVEEWTGVPSARGGYDQQTGAKVSAEFDSEYWLAYDEKFMYIAARHRDPAPGLIRANEYRTNVSVGGDDFMIFAVDPFSTLGDTSQFEINPRGATNLRIAGGRAAKREWLGEIEAKGRITADGWEVEARIPWGIIRLPSPGKRDVRATFGRVVARSGRAYILDDVSGGKGAKNIGIWKDIEIPKPEVRKSIKLLPYAFGGYDDDDGALFDGGLDFKTGVTNELDLVGSINPDFRNIENQVLSIDFSYFERLAGESRPFFLEGQNYFGTSRDAPLFASQRISDFDFGTKLYGKLGENSTLGVLNTIDFHDQNSFATNLRYNISDRTSATVAVTDLARPDVHNQGTFFSIGHGIGPYQVFGQASTTIDTHMGYGHRYNTGLSYNEAGINAILEYAEISPEYRPRLGFAPQRDFKGINSNFNYVKPVKWGKIIEVGGGLEFQHYDKYSGGGLYRQAVVGNATATLRDGTDFDFFFSLQEFGGFNDSMFFFSVEKPRGDPYRHWQLDYITGNIAGHSYQSIAPRINYRPVKNLQLNLSHQRVGHFTTQEQTIFSANYDLNQMDAISGRAIREGDDTNFYLAFRRAGNKGAEYYVILGDPNARTFRTSLVIKMVMPFELRF